MLEFTKIINKHSFTRIVVNSTLTPFFYIIRKIISLTKNDSSNIVIIALHNLGDSVFTIPAIKVALDFFRNNQIFIVCYPGTNRIFESALNNVEFIVISRNLFFFQNRIAKREARKILRKLNPGTIIDFTGVMTSASLIFNSPAKEIIGFNRPQFKAIYTHFSSPREILHVMDLYSDVLKTRIPLSKMKNYRQFQVNLQNGSRILIHPFAGWKAKEWNLKKFISLAEKLSTRYKINFAVELGAFKLDIISEIQKENIKVSECNSVADLITEIKNSSVVISNDSGPLYIANLLGKPTFTIYGPTNPGIHLPYGEHHGYIRKELKCSPKNNEKYCFTSGGRHGCPSFECMNLLSENVVLKEVEKFLDSIKISQSNN